MPPVISMLALSARPAGVAVFWPLEGRFWEWSLVWEAREPHSQSGLETQEDFCESLVVGVVAVLRGVTVMQRKSWSRTWRDCLNASR